MNDDHQRRLKELMGIREAEYRRMAEGEYPRRYTVMGQPLDAPPIVGVMQASAEVNRAMEAIHFSVGQGLRDAGVTDQATEERLTDAIMHRLRTLRGW